MTSDKDEERVDRCPHCGYRHDPINGCSMRGPVNPPNPTSDKETRACGARHWAEPGGLRPCAKPVLHDGPHDWEPAPTPSESRTARVDGLRDLIAAGCKGIKDGDDPEAVTDCIMACVRPLLAPCDHDSTRGDGWLDDHCLRCGMAGYFKDAHYVDPTSKPTKGHPSGKTLIWPYEPAQLSESSARERRDEEMRTQFAPDTEMPARRVPSKRHVIDETDDTSAFVSPPWPTMVEGGETGTPRHLPAQPSESKQTRANEHPDCDTYHEGPSAPPVYPQAAVEFLAENLPSESRTARDDDLSDIGPRRWTAARERESNERERARRAEKEAPAQPLESSEEARGLCLLCKGLDAQCERCEGSGIEPENPPSGVEQDARDRLIADLTTAKEDAEKDADDLRLALEDRSGVDPADDELTDLDVARNVIRRLRSELRRGVDPTDVERVRKLAHWYRHDQDCESCGRREPDCEECADNLLIADTLDRILTALSSPKPDAPTELDDPPPDAEPVVLLINGPRHGERTPDAGAARIVYSILGGEEITYLRGRPRPFDPPGVTPFYFYGDGASTISADDLDLGIRRVDA